MRCRTALASLILVAGILSCFILARTFVLDRITIRGHSMEPVFHEGDRVWVGKLALRTRGVRAGDAVIYHHPAKDYFVCKRCIAAPGDSVRYARTAADTTLYSGIGYAPAKGDTVALDSLAFRRYAHAIAFETGSEPVWIEGAAFLGGKRIEGYRFSRDWYYFLGDNRDHSVDSRHYGLIPKDKLLGVVMGAVKPQPLANIRSVLYICRCGRRPVAAARSRQFDESDAISPLLRCISLRVNELGGG